jgi:uncharacterized OB-fold protein
LTDLATKPPTVIDEQLASFEDGALQLWGSRCRVCGTVTFPAQRSCPRCTADGAERHPLAREGTLWTWTVQGFAPKSPPYAGTAEGFRPYGVGYIELGGEVRVESILTVADPEVLVIGMPMRVVAIPVTGREREGLVTFAFEPLETERDEH